MLDKMEHYTIAFEFFSPNELDNKKHLQYIIWEHFIKHKPLSISEE